MGKILSGLKKRQRLKNTIIVIVPDHGSSFSLMTDSNNKENEAHIDQHHVPLIIDHPILRTTKHNYRTDFVTSHIDIGPTILNFCSRKTLPKDIQGISLLKNSSLMRGVFYYQDFGIREIFLTDGLNIVGWNEKSDKFNQWSWNKNIVISRTKTLKNDWEYKIMDFIEYQSNLLNSYIDN